MAEQAVKQAEKKTFTLPNEKVKVEFIRKQRGNVTNPKHVLFGGMSEGAKRRLVPIRSKTTFQYIRILSDAEEKVLESLLALPENGLSVYKTHDNFWDGLYVDLIKEGITLDLSNPYDYIKYKLVLSYTNLVAPSLADLKLNNFLTYMFVVVKAGERTNIEVDVYNTKKEAYKIADKLETNLASVKEFLFLCGIKSSPSSSTLWLKSRLGQLVEDDPKKVIDIHTSSDYTTRALIARGVLSGVIQDSNGKFTLEGGVILAEEGEVPTLGNAVKYLANKANADVKNVIEAKIGK